MVNWLYSFPDSVLIASSAVLVALTVAILPRLIRLMSFSVITAENTDFILRIHSTLFTLTGFALAFTLVQAQANFRQAEAVVNSEASHINNLDRLLVRYGDPSAVAIRPGLMAYATSIVVEEWPMMTDERGNERTLSAFIPVARAVAAINPATARQTTMYGEMLKFLDAIAESREARLEIAAQGLPGVYWAAVLVAISVLILASAVVLRTPFRTFFLSAQAAVLGAFIGILFITDHPFKGQTSVHPEAIEKVISAIKARER